MRQFTRALAEINVVTKFMQTARLSLANCRMAFDELQKKVNLKVKDRHHAFYQCQFKCVKSAVDSRLSPNQAFESGVIKIQERKIAELSNAEKAAVESLKRSTVEDNEVVVVADDEGVGGESDDSHRLPSPNIDRMLTGLKETLTTVKGK